MKKYLITLTVAALSVFTAFTAPVGPAFTYQGQLIDGGQPASGQYDFSFILYDGLTNGAMVGNPVYLSAVPVSNGLFTVQLNENNEFGVSAWNGAARWLEIYTRTNNNSLGNNFVPLAPRQPLTPAPLAQTALNALTAANASNVADGVITAAKLAPGTLSWSGLSGLPPGFADGVDNDTTYSAGAGLTLSEAGNKFIVSFGTNGVADVAARSDHDHFGQIWSGLKPYDGFGILNNATNGLGIFGRQGPGSGTLVPVGGFIAGLHGDSAQGDGVIGTTANGRGVYGAAVGTTLMNYGVYGRSPSALGRGVFGHASSTTGPAFGVYGMSDSAQGKAVVGQSTALTGNTVGVYGETDSSTGMGVYGYAAVSGANYGVYGRADSAAGVGVLAQSSAGVALKAAGTGIIQSDADSVLWFPAAGFALGTDRSEVSLFVNAVYAEVQAKTAGTISWAMPLNLPNVLFGQPVTVKKVEVFYQCQNGAHNLVSDSNLYLVKTDGTFKSLSSGGPFSSNVPSSYTMSPNWKLSASDGALSLLISTFFANTSEWIRFTGVRVVLGHN